MKRKQGVILSYILMIFEVLSTLLLTPYILRTLGQAEYGVYKLSASITAYLLLLDLGVGNSIIRFVSQYRANRDVESERKFFAIGLLYYGFIALIVIVVGVVLILVFPTVFSNGLNEKEIVLGQKLLGLTVINATVTIGTTLFNNILIAYEKFSISKGFSILQIIIRFIATICVLKLGFGSLGVVTVTLSLTVFTRVMFILYVLFVIKIKPEFHGLSFGFIKEIITYSSLILLQMVATQINASLDQILIGSLVASSSIIITTYSIGTQIVQYFQSIGSAFNGVLMPGVVRLVEQQPLSEKLCDEMVRIGRILFMILGIIWGGFLVFGKQFITLWAGNYNTKSYFVALILMTAYLFIITESIGTQILWAKNSHKEQSFMKLVVVLLNIALTIILIKWNPLYGATIGTFISLFVGDIVVMNIIFSKKIKISLKQYYKNLFKGLGPCLIMVVILGTIINLIPLSGWLGLCIKIGLMCIGYLILLLLFGMNKYEKSLIMSVVKIKWSK